MSATRRQVPGIVASILLWALDGTPYLQTLVMRNLRGALAAMRSGLQEDQGRPPRLSRAQHTKTLACKSELPDPRLTVGAVMGL